MRSGGGTLSQPFWNGARTHWKITWAGYGRFWALGKERTGALLSYATSAWATGVLWNMPATTATKSSSSLCRKTGPPFSDRFSLIKQGVRDMKGSKCISGGDFIISNATFPTYFIKGTDELAAQTKLDATVFATRIAPAL